MADLRMPDVNKVLLVGRLTRDPELKYLASGVALCRLGLAVSRVYRTPDGEKKEDVTFVNVSTWDKQAEFVNDKLRKGRPILVEGRLTSNEWEDKSGQKRTTIEVRADRIQQLDWDDDRGGAPAPSRPQPRQFEEPIPEDDIPF